MELKYQPLFYYSFFLCDGASCQVKKKKTLWINPNTLMRTNAVMGTVNVELDCRHGPPLLHLVREKLSTGAPT